MAQRQQKKQQQSDAKKAPAKGGKDGRKPVPATRKKPLIIVKEASKLNGIDGTSESSASSSLQSSESSESTLPPPLISFQGVLRNGLNVSFNKSLSFKMVCPQSMHFLDIVFFLILVRGVVKG